MAHHKYFGSTVLCRFLVKLECLAIAPAGAGLFVVVESEPNVFELTNLRVVLTPPQINDVGDTEGLELLRV